MAFDLNNYENVKSRKLRFYADNPDARIVIDIRNIDTILDYALVVAKVYLNKEDQANDLPRGVGSALELRDTEKATSKSGKAYESVNFSSWVENCFHGDTEILTKRGWIKISDYVETKVVDEVAQKVLPSGAFSFAKPLRKVKEKSGELLLIEDNVNSQCVTPEHNVVIGGKLIKASSVKAGQINEFDNSAMNKRTSGGYYESEWHARFHQWLIADGCIKNGNILSFGFKKGRKVSRFQDILNGCGIKYEVFNRKSGVIEFVIKRAGIFVRDYSKTLKIEQVLSMSRDEAVAFIDEIGFTDGTFCSKGTGAVILRQTDFLYSQNLSLLCFLNGYSISGVKENENIKNRYPNGKPITTQRINKSVRRTKTTIKHLLGDFDVYCLTMPAGTLVVRYKGKITVSGNCEESAVGRALDNAGYASNGKCSAEEIQKSERMKDKVVDLKTCPVCGKTHNGKFDKCYQCWLAGQKKAEPVVEPINNELPF